MSSLFPGERGGKTKQLKEVVQIRYLKPPVLQNPSCTNILHKPLYNACRMAVFVVQSCTDILHKPILHCNFASVFHCDCCTAHLTYIIYLFQDPFCRYSYNSPPHVAKPIFAQLSLLCNLYWLILCISSRADHL